MKYFKKISIKVLVLVFITTSVRSQSFHVDILGDWIKTQVTFINGEELPDHKEIKHNYIRYTFEPQNKLFIGFVFDSKGTAFSYRISNNILETINEYGFIINSFLIERLDSVTMVLVQKGIDGFDESECIRYYFQKENLYQKSLPLRAEDIVSINRKDTLFRASEKVHAKFKGQVSFHKFLTENIPEYSNVVASNNYFLVTFIVRKNGEVDSVRVLEGINKNFEKQFLKAFNKARKNWIPAQFNGLNVDVLMSEEFKFVSGSKFLPHYQFGEKGKRAMDAKDYVAALYYFEKSLEKVPDASDILFHRAICRLKLGNRELACEDFEKLKSLREYSVEKLIDENCN